MRRFQTWLTVSAVALSLSGVAIAPSDAAPMRAAQPVAAPSDIVRVQGSPNDWRHPDYRGIRPDQGRNWNRGRNWDGRRNYRGERGWRDGRRYYRNNRYYRHRGNDDFDFWGPAIGGFVAGAIVNGMINQPRTEYYVDEGPAYRGDAHVRWCLDRYRSYDVRSDTFQPYHGPRRYCNSPYN